jgi:hypothetical protein
MNPTLTYPIPISSLSTWLHYKCQTDSTSTYLISFPRTLLGRFSNTIPSVWTIERPSVCSLLYVKFFYISPSHFFPLFSIYFLFMLQNRFLTLDNFVSGIRSYKSADCPKRLGAFSGAHCSLTTAKMDHCIGYNPVLRRHSEPELDVHNTIASPSASASEPGSDSSWSVSSLPYASDFVSDYASCISLTGSQSSFELVRNSALMART